MTEVAVNAKKVESNLFGFYQTLAKIHDYPCAKIASNLYWAIAESEPFPNYIFGDSVEDKMEKIIAEIEQGKLPKYWICKNNNGNEELIELHHFKKLANWPAMILNLKNQQKTIETGFSKIEQDSLIEFVNIVNENNFGKMNASNIFFSALLNNKDVLRLYGYKCEKGITTVGLIFGKDEIAGLYFFCTKKEFQGKGYGTTFMKNLIIAEASRGTKSITLQANASSKNIFEKLGFESCSNFDIYGYVGK